MFLLWNANPDNAKQSRKRIPTRTPTNTNDQMNKPGHCGGYDMRTARPWLKEISIKMADIGILYEVTNLPQMKEHAAELQVVIDEIGELLKSKPGKWSLECEDDRIVIVHPPFPEPEMKLS